MGNHVPCLLKGTPDTPFLTSMNTESTIALDCMGGDFGIAVVVPAALMGVDCRRLLQSAQAMATACAPGTPLADNPGVRLGCVMGAAALAGRDKLTLVQSPSLASFGAWLEQPVATVIPRPGKRLTIHRDDALALFAG